MFARDAYSDPIHEAIAVAFHNLDHSNVAELMKHSLEKNGCYHLIAPLLEYNHIRRIHPISAINGEEKTPKNGPYEVYQNMRDTRPKKATPVDRVKYPDNLMKFVASGGMAMQLPDLFPGGKWDHKIAAKISKTDYFRHLIMYIPIVRYQINLDRPVTLRECVNLLEFVLRRTILPQMHVSEHETRLAEVYHIISDIAKYASISNILNGLIIKNNMKPGQYIVHRFVERFIYDNARCPSHLATDEYEFTCAIICAGMMNDTAQKRFTEPIRACAKYSDPVDIWPFKKFGSNPPHMISDTIMCDFVDAPDADFLEKFKPYNGIFEKFAVTPNRSAIRRNSAIMNNILFINPPECSALKIKLCNMARQRAAKSYEKKLADKFNKRENFINLIKKTTEDSANDIPPASKKIKQTPKSREAPKKIKQTPKSRETSKSTPKGIVEIPGLFESASAKIKTPGTKARGPETPPSEILMQLAEMKRLFEEQKRIIEDQKRIIEAQKAAEEQRRLIDNQHRTIETQKKAISEFNDIFRVDNTDLSHIDLATFDHAQINMNIDRDYEIIDRENIFEIEDDGL
jgi:hypothetical protein